jgi:glucose-6-phosphate isomerase
MEKIYGGNAKIVETKFGQMIKISQSRSDLEKLLNYLNDNDLEWVSQVMKEKQQKVEGKPTHYLEVDEWKPNAVKEKNEFKPSTEKKQNFESYGKDSLPF